MNEEEQEQQAMQQDYLEAISTLRDIREVHSDVGDDLYAAIDTTIDALKDLQYNLCEDAETLKEKSSKAQKEIGALPLLIGAYFAVYCIGLRIKGTGLVDE